MRAVLLALLVAAGPAAACGYCLEDQVAATYDHAVVTAAMARKHHVVFFHVDGTVRDRSAIERAVYAAPAIDRGTVRVSNDLLTVSFAFDPSKATLAAIHARAEKELGLPLMPLEVIDQPGALKAVRAR